MKPLLSHLDTLQNLSRYLPYLLFGTIILLELGFLVCFFPTTLDTIKTEQNKVSALTEENKKLAAAQTILGETNPKAIEDNLFRVTTALPNEKKISGLVTGLTGLASSSGVAVSSLEFSPGLIATAPSQLKSESQKTVSLPNNVLAVPTSLSVNTGLSSLISLLRSLNSISQLVSVRAVSVGTTGKGQTSAQFSVLVYYQPVNNQPVDFKNVQALTPEDRATINSLSSKDVLTLPGQR